MTAGRGWGPPRGGGFQGGRRGAGAAPRPPLDANLVIAPFRFAAIADEVALPPSSVSEAAARGELLSMPQPGGFDGSIEVTWEAETPLLIGQTQRNKSGQDDSSWSAPMRTGEGGDFWIPGSSLRGMLRTACEIVGFGRLSQTNKHYVFSLRDFLHPHYSDPDGSFDGSPITRPKEAKGGWLYKRPAGGRSGASDYCIEPADLAYVDVEALLDSRDHINRRFGHQEWIESSLEKKYEAAGLTQNGAISVTKKTFQFRRDRDDAQGRRRLLPDAKGSIKGHLFFANATPRVGARFNPATAKKVEFVLLPYTGAEQVTQISADAWRRFELVHTKPGRTERDPEGSWKILKKLVEAGERVPIVYVGDLARQNKVFAFGLTRLFKIPHKQGVGDVLARQEGHVLARGNAGYVPDMIEALFGHVHEPGDYARENGAKAPVSHPGDALKGRVAVSGARILRTSQQEPQEGDWIDTAMMAPRASFGPFYLAGETKDWSDDGSRLAGRKLYLPRCDGSDVAAREKALKARLEHQIKALPEQARRNQQTRSHLRFLRDARGRVLRFSHRIDLQNVTDVEIGLLLFALTHGGDKGERYRHLIGRARPFGAGRLRLASARLSLRRHVDGAAVEGEDRETHRPFLDAFVRHMREDDSYSPTRREAHKFPDVQAVRDWLAASDPAEGAKLRGPQPPVLAPDDGSVEATEDTYLRLSYRAPGRERMVRINPYLQLRKSTQLLKIDDRPFGPDRLLPGEPPKLKR